MLCKSLKYYNQLNIIFLYFSAQGKRFENELKVVL